jgi:tetratricopeptide (TPR) repeat protein
MEYDAKNYANADKLFARAIQADPKYAPARANRALSLFRLGDRDAARIEANTALELRPGYIVATQALTLIDGKPPAQMTAPPAPKELPLRCDRASETTLKGLDAKTQLVANALCRSMTAAELSGRPTVPWKGATTPGVSVDTGKRIGKAAVWCSCSVTK